MSRRIRRLAASAVCLIPAFWISLWGAEPAALEEYVRRPDPAYRFEVLAAYPGKGFTHIVVEMTSQSWLTEAEVDRPLWKHWLNIVIPDDVKGSTALLFIGGGSNTGEPPRTVGAMFRRIALAGRAVVAELRMVPNQPLVFRGDGKPRQEDEIIAFAWDKFLRTGQAKWLPRLPMTKAAVRAMDTVTALCKKRRLAVDRFVVAGGSKRGWTTWTTAAIDKRVVAFAPIVIDLLNLEPSFIHHWRAYGFWAPAVNDYVQAGIMNWMGRPEFHALLEAVEPYQFRHRFTMPKYLINSAGDQFFLPDSSQFYFDDLPGEKYLRYVPNSDHSLDDTDALESFLPWFQAILDGRPRPRFTWELLDNGGIRLKTQDAPREVKLWQATNPKARDFRLDTIGKAWRSSPVAGDAGVFEASVPAPPQGWTAWFLELTYESGTRYPFKFTTPVRVVPDTLPFPPPAPKEKVERNAGSATPAAMPAAG